MRLRWKWPILEPTPIFANRVRTKLLATAKLLLGQTPQKKPTPISFQQRYQETFNVDPLTCNNCGTSMVLSHIVIVDTDSIKQRVRNKNQELIRNHRSQNKACNSRAP